MASGAVEFRGTNHLEEHFKMAKRETLLPGPGEHVDTEERLHDKATVYGLTKELQEKSVAKAKQLKRRMDKVEQAQLKVERAAQKASADAHARALLASGEGVAEQTITPSSMLAAEA
jgi:hypothetical protein